MFRLSEIMTHRDRHLDMQVDIGEAQMVRELVVPRQRKIVLSGVKPLDRLWCRGVSWLQRLDLSAGYPASPSAAHLADEAWVPSPDGSCCLSALASTVREAAIDYRRLCTNGIRSAE